MAMAKRTLIFLTVVALFGASIAAVHNVGDAAGWTSMNIIDYKKWADRRTFRVGDTLIFKYNPQRHDVKQVNEADFKLCNAKSPIASYDSGSDSITLKEPGRVYFICGFGGHCEDGQKVDILVQSPASPTPSPRPSPSPSPSPTSTSTSFSLRKTVPSSTAPSLYSSNFWLVSGALIAFSLARFGF